MTERSFYFGYGSNLDRDHLGGWLRRNGYSDDLLVPRGSCFLPDRELAFTRRSKKWGGGVLDVPDRRGSLVEGVIFEVRENGWDALDEKEGAGRAYRRVESVALTYDGLATPVTTYEVVPELREEFVPPAAEYLEIVRRGRAAHGLVEDLDDQESDSALDSVARGKRWGCGPSSIFVYGTLMRGEARFGAIATNVGSALLAETSGRLLDLGDWPALSPDRGGCVRGELLGVRDIAGCLDRLDAVEGFRGFGAPGSLFERRLVFADVGRGHLRPAWTYAMDGLEVPAAPVISSGDWRRHRGRRRSFLERLIGEYVRGQDEALLRRAVAERAAWPFGDPSFLDARTLVEALEGDLVQERDLCSVTDRFAVIPEM